MARPSLDRIDPDGNYSIGNIRWLELSENRRLARRGKQWPVGKRGCARCKQIFDVQDIMGSYCKACNISRVQEYRRSRKREIDSLTCSML
jgi:hypothetical protein